MEGFCFWDFQFHSEERRISVVSMENECCRTHSRGQKKQLERFGSGHRPFRVLAGEDLIKSLGLFVTLEAAMHSLRVQRVWVIWGEGQRAGPLSSKSCVGQTGIR